jgi:hypothetical protein
MTLHGSLKKCSGNYQPLPRLEYSGEQQSLKKLQAVATSVATACCSPQNNFKVSRVADSRKNFFYFFSRSDFRLKN